jgi:hypothetical protein
MRFVLILTFLSCAPLVKAQEQSQWKSPLVINSVHLAVGASVDRFKDINRDFIASTAVEEGILDLNLDGLRPTYGERAVASSLFISAFLSPRELNNTSLFQRSEWSIGYGIHSSRELRAGYSSELLDTTINFCNFSSERSLEVSYRVHFFTGEATTLYAGLGGNVSTTRNNEVMMIGGGYVEDDVHPSFIFSRPESQFRFAAKSRVNTRVFGVFGINMHRTKRADYTLQFRPGIGFISIPGQPIRIMPYTGGFNFGYRFYFRERDVKTRKLVPNSYFR